MLFIQCKKGKTDTEQPSVEAQKIIKFKELAKEVLALAKNPTFKKVVYDECKSQKFGDYYVRVEDLFKKSTITTSVSSDKVAVVMKIVSDLKALGARAPIIFYPSVETKEDRKKLLNARTTDEEEVVSVIDESGGVGYTNDQYPGYRFNTDGQLAYYQQITEEFAWEHDVWVIGEEENCSEDNMVAAPEDFILNPDPLRVQGQPEYAAIIQVTDLGALETWILGKMEFKITVMNSSGGVVFGPQALGKVKRKYFRDLRWYDYNRFIGNWNSSTFGNWMYEHWLEEDGGNSASISISMPPPSGFTGPTTTTTIPSRNLDDNMGLTTIQFSDAITQVYNISYANIKRKN